MCGRILRALLIPAAVSLLAGCALDLVSEPSASIMAGSSGASTDTLRPPTNVSASHGEYRSVRLSWSSASGAVQYYIYSAATPFDMFRQTAETKGTANSISITEDAGTTAYYAISTVDKDGNVSEKSFIVLGSVLSSPIITGITQDSSGTASTVTWWMANCSPGTYMDIVKYEVTCYAEDRTSVVATVNTQGSETSATFRNLTPNTKYYYQVQAFTSMNQSSMESSGLEDADTARRLIPSAPQDLQAATGTSAESVELTWTLPDYVDYKVGSESYEQHPVYFTIERKEKDEDDSGYTKIVSYLGTIDDSNDGSESRITFDCAGQTSSSANVSVTAGDASSAGGAYGAYIPGSRLTWRDTTAERGRQYVWRVQSYTDDSGTIISSQESASTAEGWLLAPVSFKASAEYTEKDAKYTGIDVSFQADFEDFGQKYGYVLAYTRTGFEEGSKADEEKPLGIYDSISKVKAEHHVFDESGFLSDDSIASAEGYYRYTLYIAPAGTTSILSEYYARADSPNSITVTNSADRLPSINRFTVTDGYADKFVLEWDYDENCEYTVSWVNYKDETTPGNDAEPMTKELTASEISVHDGTARYEHEASPGDCRAYSLIADKGLRTERSHTDGENRQIVSCTLGKADLIPGQPDYSAITVQWRAVQRAGGEYKVSAVYSGEDEELTQGTDEGGDGYTLITEDNGIYTCVINRPRGYDDALKSGKAVTFTVTATSASQKDETTTSETETRTAGPALLETKAAAPESDSIKITWKAMDFAQGYIIRRIRYTDGSARTAASQSDTYYYDGTTLTADGEPVDGTAQVTRSGDTYTLIDMYSEQKDESSPYQTNQSMISWGLPYGYAVFPVRKGGSPDDFSFGEGITPAGSSKVMYRNISDVRNAAYGYGLKVRAQKASSSSDQRIEWEPPYHNNNSANLYRRPAGSGANSWEKVTDIPAGKNEISYRPAPGEITEAYEYAVAYRKSTDRIELPASLVNGTSADKGLSEEETNGENYTYTDGSQTERLNKGYLLATNFSAGYGGDSAANSADQYYYSEKVTWSEWDYDKRAIGPTGAYVSIKNYNLSNDWTKVFSLDSGLHYERGETVLNTDIWKADEVTAYLAPSEVATADSVNSGSMVNTDGPLMVLRDAKHYYSLTLVRESISVSLAEDDSVYACRQLSDAEIARAAMLALSYGFYVHDSGVADYSKAESQHKYADAGTVTGGAGTMSFTKGSYEWLSGKYNATYSLTGNFAPGQLTPSGTTGTCVGISSGSPFTGSFRMKGTSDYYLFEFGNTDSIIVKASDSSIPVDYSATISFICPDADSITLKITRNANETLLCDSKSDGPLRKRWCPMQIHSYKRYEITNPEYGWWPE